MKRDKNSNILNINTNFEDNTYSYDKLDRLTRDTVNNNPAVSNIPIDYTYDLNDNRLTRILNDLSSDQIVTQVASSNRIQTQDTLQIGVDPIAALPNRDMVYNDVGRLFQLYEEGTLKAEYIYNDEGQRTRKTTYQADGITIDSITIFHYDHMGYLITETTETGALIKDYIWEEGMHPVAQIDNSLGTENVLYLYTDHLMTNRLATDQTQGIVWRWEGEAFGNTPADEIGGLSINLRFPGQYFDSETSLHYNRFRYYDSALGRYITSDPIGLGGGLNSYAYVFTNPIRLFDLTGLKVTGRWLNGGPSASVQGSGINSVELLNPLEWRVRGLDGYLRMVEVEGSVWGVLSASVECMDDCSHESWVTSRDYQLSHTGSFRTGPNLWVVAGMGALTLATGPWAGAAMVGIAAKVGIGASANVLALGLNTLSGISELENKWSNKASKLQNALNSYGPDAICESGWPDL